MNSKISQFIYDAALEISIKIKSNFSGENTEASTNENIKDFLIKAKYTLEEIYNKIEIIHQNLITEGSLPFVDKIIVDCEHVLISINSINLKIEILIINGISKIQASSALIKSLFCEFLNKLKLLCEEELKRPTIEIICDDQLKAFFIRIMCYMELFKTLFSTLVLQMLELSAGTFLNTLYCTL